jgi:uncharacterized damage-inducible protein DinB
MRTLQAMYAYNAWANAQVFGVCQGVDRAQMEEHAAGTTGTVEDTLKHLVEVEDAYLLMLRGETTQAMGPRETYFAYDLAWLAQRAAELSRAYQELLARADAAFYDAPLAVPWFSFALTKHDGLLQVLSHSAQHRAQVLSALGERGMEVPDIDYVLYVESQQAPDH